MKKFQLPYGVQDFMPEEFYNKSLVQDKLSEVFSLNGFDRVQPSSLEYFEFYGQILGSNKIDRIFKLTDNDGGLLVLRPDTTLQIMRIAATKCPNNKINKFYYIENSFEYLPNTSSPRSREFEQAGVEMLGDSGVNGDIEIVTMAIEALLKSGLSKFLIELGNVQFIKGMLLETGVTESDAKTLRGLLNNKDMLGVERFFNSNNVSEEFLENFLKLPTLFGGAEILDEARKIGKHPLCVQALDNLSVIMNALKARGLDGYVNIDLGISQGEYYTGLILRGLIDGEGASVLDGGRYDNLGDYFAAPMQAVGFAIGIKRLLVALDKQGKLSRLSACDFAYISDGNSTKKEYQYISKLRSEGKRVTKCFFVTEQQLKEYCISCNIKNAFSITEGQIKEIKGL